MQKPFSVRTLFLSVAVLSGIGFLGYTFLSKPSVRIVDYSAQDPLAQTHTNVDATKTVLTHHDAGQSSSNLSVSLPDIPSSFFDSFVKPQFLLDEQGNLIITADLKNLFDSFLALNHLLSIDQIEQHINQYLTNALSGAALIQAQSILTGYLAFKRALSNTPSTGLALLDSTESINPNDLLDHLNTQRQLRSQYLSSDVIAAFFGEQDKLDDYTLSRLAITFNRDLSPDEKQHALSVLEATTDSSIIASRKAADPVSTQRAQENQLREDGASSEEIYQHRVETLGVEAANRYAELDQSRAQWQQKLAAYEQEKSELLNQAGITETEKSQQLEQLKTAHFTPQEQMRVMAYEKRKAFESAANP